MSQNLVKETYQADTNWVCPSGVTKVILTTYKLYRSQFAGGSSSMFINSDGTLWAAGLNSSGQLGTGNTTSQSSPVPVVGALRFNQVSSFVFSGDSWMGTATNGTLWTWGNNSSGSMGDNTVVNKSSPVAVLGTTVVQQQPFFAKGAACMGAIGYNLDTYMWGQNFSGQLGDGTVVAKSTPVLVLGGRKFRFLAGDGATLALTEDGTAWAWGNAFQGVLGDGTVVPKSTPVLVSGNTKFKYIATGGNNSMAIAQDGSLWGWGEKSSNGTLPGVATSVSTPTLLTGYGATKFKTLSMAGNSPHVVALSEDGDLYAWGANYAGQCGNGLNTSTQSTPTLVVGNKKWIAVAAGIGWTIAVDTDGKYWAWGRDTDGRLGIGSSAALDYSSPVAVAGALRFNQPKKFVSRFIIDVVPGTTYPIKIGDWFALFNGQLYGTDAQEATLEYYG